MALFLGLLAHQEGQALGQRPQGVHGLELRGRSVAVPLAARRDRRVGGSKSSRVQVIRSRVGSISSRNRARMVNPRMPSIDAPGSPRAFMPTSWNGSSTRALMSEQPRPAFEVEPIDGRPELPLGRLQPDLAGRLGGDVEGRGPGVDQEVERPLAVDPHPDQEMVRVGQPVGDLERLADLGIAAQPGGRGRGRPGLVDRRRRPVDQLVRGPSRQSP